jgi:hypothetical protein
MPAHVVHPRAGLPTLARERPANHLGFALAGAGSQRRSASSSRRGGPSTPGAFGATPLPRLSPWCRRDPNRELDQRRAQPRVEPRPRPDSAAPRVVHTCATRRGRTIVTPPLPACRVRHSAWQSPPAAHHRTSNSCDRSRRPAPGQRRRAPPFRRPPVRRSPYLGCQRTNAAKARWLAGTCRWGSAPRSRFGYATAAARSSARCGASTRTCAPRFLGVSCPEKRFAWSSSSRRSRFYMLRCGRAPASALESAERATRPHLRDPFLSPYRPRSRSQAMWCRADAC